jgi:hypothetical protein
MLNKLKSRTAGKTKLLISALLLSVLFISFIFNLSKETKTEQPPLPVNMLDSFMFGAMEDSHDQDFQYISGELGFNVWHKYIADATYNSITGRHYPKGWVFPSGQYNAPGDTLNAQYSDYASDVIAILNNTYNHNGMRTFMQRPKIEYLCYGQSSVYQAEQVNHNNDYWFYSFNESIGESEPDSQWNGGNYVLHCSEPENGPNAGIVLKRLKANTEQCNNSPGWDTWRTDAECDWLIKPRIRIDSNVAHDPQNPLICNIRVLAQNGSTELKNVDIYAINFLDDNLNYNGRYLEEYFSHPGYSLNLTIHGPWSNNNYKWAYSARGNKTEQQEWADTNTNHADIQVYWYDNCDMWIDYVKVENDVADRLLGTPPDPDFEQWLDWEATIAGASNSPLVYYSELFEFNNIPCVAYVSHKLDSICFTRYGKHFNVMSDLLTLYQYHMPWDNRGEIDAPDKVKRMYFDRTGAQQIFLGDPYPIVAAYPNGCAPQNYNQFSKIPNTLTPPSGNEVLAVRVSPTEYDNYLHYLFDTRCRLYENFWQDENCCPGELRGVFLYLMKHGDAISKEVNKPFIAMLQAHQWVWYNGEMEREPTDEEIKMMSNVAVSYGARGIIYWPYNSWWYEDCYHSFGVTDADFNGHPRNNVYGQDKWDNLKKTIFGIKKWQTYLMSFDNQNRHSYIYSDATERAAMCNNTYIRDVVTFRPSEDVQPDCGLAPPGEYPVWEGKIYDCPDDRYVQVATFKIPNDSSQYFMIVNRRCSPFKNEYNDDSIGGMRFIRTWFNPNAGDFAGANNWKVIDLLDNRVVGTIDKTQISRIDDQKYFLPGEGRLYKITPTVKSGGILVCDEYVTSGQTFTCEDTVFNNGYNITLAPHVTVHFTDTSKFVMDGGMLIFGDSTISSTPNVINDAISGNTWWGHEFTNCEVRIYNTAFSNLKDDSTYAVNTIDCPLD